MFDLGMRSIYSTIRFDNRSIAHLPFKPLSQHSTTDHTTHTTQTDTDKTETMRPFQEQQPRCRRRLRLRSPRRGRTLLFAAVVGLALLGSLALLLCGPGMAAAAVASEAEEADRGGVAVFVPTREWQVIPEGAAIPPVSF